MEEKDDCIILKIPRSIKGRWVAAIRPQRGTKLDVWLIERIAAGNLDHYQPLAYFADAPDEPRADVVIRCTRAYKQALRERAHALDKSLTEVIVNLAESSRLFEARGDNNGH